MTLFLMNLLLAVIWVLLWGRASAWTIGTGLIGGYFVLWIFTRVHGRDVLRRAYGGRVVDTVRFAIYFLALLIRSNLALAWEILTPHWRMSPRIVRYDVSHLTGPQIVAFSNALTLTPGTLTVDISDDQQRLYIHCMYAADRERAIRDLDDLRLRMERDVFRLSEPVSPPKPQPVAGAWEDLLQAPKARNTPIAEEPHAP